MDYNAEQIAAIGCTNQHILVLAGAGTGKTRTIIGRAARLLREGCPASRMAIITFTRRAAAEIRRRLESDVGTPASSVVTGTFHNFCLREMSAHRNWFGLGELTIMDRDDQVHLMKLVRGDILNNARRSQAPQAAELVNYYSYARNTNQPPADYLEKFTEHDPSTIALILQVFEAYKQRKRRSGYLDFDDILHRFAKVMREDAQIRSHIAKRYDHVLVDEMQDTNPLQWLILESLAPQVQLFCVGDDAQSIYAFRGADFRNVHSFSQRLPGAETLKLEMNYRSTQEILDLSNWLLAQSSLKYNKRLRAVRGTGVRPMLVELDSELDEAEFVVDQAIARQAQGLRWQDQMILCRTAFSARPVEGELIRKKIPYRLIGGVGLLQAAHVKDLLAVLRIAVNHRDELSWIRYLTMWPRIGEATAARYIAQLSDMPDTTRAVEHLGTLSANPEMLQPLRTAVTLLGAPATSIEHLAELMDDLMESRYDNWSVRRREFKLLHKLAERYEHTKDFLDTYTLDPVTPSQAEAGDNDDLLTIITVHSAKGTEAKVCYVIAAQPGNYPHSRSRDKAAIEEERRVLYVALTRAQDELIISRNFSQPSYQSTWRNPVASEYLLQGLPHSLVNVKQQVKLHRRSRSEAYWDEDLIS
ncbi:MAG: ATP-dependent helicase [Pirellulaceae bacterium]|nr:ATP-dependent helicase [Pirellulaceae bacterium]